MCVSIIIVTYNNIKYTKQCIDSILKNTISENYEIIIVDNLSTDATRGYLGILNGKYKNINVILNKNNYGFAKANNIGISKANGDYIVLLNNDTIVTKNWLTNLIRHLKNDSNLGMVGPVTNSIGNESKIDVTYENIDTGIDINEMEQFAKNYTTQNQGLLYEKIDMLALFCVVFPRKIINEVDYLDEQFGLGMYEDDDFSYRIKQKGYKIACAEDSFVHHYGNASFKNLKNETFEELMNKNKNIFEKKWGVVWKPHLDRERRINSEFNQHVNHRNLSDFYHKYSFKNQKVIFVSSGPSVYENINYLRSASAENIKIFCVANILNVLLENEIYPTAICYISQKDNSQYFFKGKEKNIKIPLIFLYTSNCKVVSNYNGERYMFFNYKNHIQEVNINTESLDIAMLDIITMGKPKEVVLVGEDFENENQYHSWLKPKMEKIMRNNNQINYIYKYE